ncbi:sensor histidine kinase NtrY-like [Sphingomicrobium marinum]|uniref:sensor histidine kinase NtrY-like n=1 Tax=Sphingomicrobium marinum TaxID=1227950 RepID=UPI00223F6ECF|nr:ATP-binding protein [Sphingomicrobium marinum]
MTHIDERPRYNRWLDIAMVASAVILVAMLVYSGDLMLHEHNGAGLLSPPIIATLMVATLVPAIVLMVLISRKVAYRRSAKQGLGSGRLHTRLVAIFSIIAAVPTVVVAIFASLLIQSGLEFWSSDRAENLVTQAVEAADAIYENEFVDVTDEAAAMAGDISNFVQTEGVDSPDFGDFVAYQAYLRSLNEAAVLSIDAQEQTVQAIGVVNGFEGIDDKTTILPRVEELAQLEDGDGVSVEFPDRIAVLTKLPQSEDGYLLAIRYPDSSITGQVGRADNIVDAYNDLLAKSRTNQLRFNAALLLGAIIIVGLAILAALALADRLARPIGQLVTAAGRVEEGDFGTRVPELNSGDEVAKLATAFNRMTSRIEDQTGALLTANEQLDLRRAFMEAVLSSVTAGVIALDDQDHILLTNRSAAMLLGDEGLEGRYLHEVSPELSEFMRGETQEATATIMADTGPRTLAVKRVRYDDGAVLTFDDITDQLSDQRRAAWSDIARRIAHEIKNPLTPIQLAAERLQRKYGDEIKDDTFGRLTDTIVRQVGDLRRMVDEFSNFARMPKPTFRDENVHDIARAALFLHEVAHPGVAFSMDPPSADIRMVCDRRQLAQALTNIVKNAVEAIESRRKTGGDHPDGDRVDLTMTEGSSELRIDIMDTGVGLPEDRERLTEPYMTTRVRGTGLGLAIVKKIVEEHEGEIAFLDRDGGGTHVRILFHTDRLAEKASGEAGEPLEKSGEDGEYDEGEE